jgi:3-isopropylmalate/(R)-2-methylmalate dehydratase small subunit
MIEKIIDAKIWKFGEDIDTDIIMPTQFLAMKTVEDMKKYAFSPLRPEIAAQIKCGDVIVAEKNFGCGSSREQAASVLNALGIKCVIAKSFARIFYRNAFNNGLLLLENDELPDACNEGDKLTVDLESNVIRCNGKEFKVAAIPPNLCEMIEAGGLVPYMQKMNGISQPAEGR